MFLTLNLIGLILLTDSPIVRNNRPFLEVVKGLSDFRCYTLSLLLSNTKNNNVLAPILLSSYLLNSGCDLLGRERATVQFCC